MRDERTLLVIALLVVAAGTAAIWYFRSERPLPPPAAEAPPAAPESAPAGEPVSPRYPVRLPEEPAETEAELRPLPPLDDSDEYFKLELTDLFGQASEELIVASGLIERVVATVDNLPRERVSERIRPVTPLSEPFIANDSEAGDGRYTLNEQNYNRYDPLVEQFVSTDIEELVAVYRRYYPLFQKAYVGQGYPDGYFNDRLVEVIDHLLETPHVEGPIELTRPHVMYEYADPELEALSGGQKLILRLGPDNRRRVEEKLQQLRARIVDT